MKKLLLLCAFVAGLSADGYGYYNYAIHDSSEYKKMMQGNIFQILSLHVGSGFDLTNDKAGLDVGFSAGWNYFEVEDEEVDFGLRFKYLYSNQNARLHSFGLNLYIHPFTYYIYPNVPTIQPVSFIIGAGGIVAKNTSNSASGGYVEAGIALFKWFPVNVDIVYKASFYGSSKTNIGKTAHGIHVLLGIM